MGDLRERIERLPGAPELLGLPHAHLVGGAVRDLLRGADPVDLDLVIEGDALEAARSLAERLGGEVVEHDRFGTATVTGLPLELNLATARRERYSAPGALPDVEPAGIDEDLARRDFTVNAMAVRLSGDDAGVLRDPLGGRADLDAGLIRVLHDGSFADDPTRLLRAVRYAARLGGRLEPHTEELARAAVAKGAMRTVSGPRVWDELGDLLAEPAVGDALELMRSVGLDRALGLTADPDRVASALLGASETGADPRLAALAALVAADPAGLRGWVNRLGLTKTDSYKVVRAASEARHLASTLTPDLAPSAIHALLEFEPPESLALALAFGAPGEPILRYVGELSGARLDITGDDLVAAGVPQSKAIGRALAETLRRKLDGEVSGREDELALALSIARGEARAR